MGVPHIRFRVDFEDRCSVGVGKIELLEAIQRDGSLSAAARSIGMSYRRAWLLINSMNCEFDTPLVCATTGGSGGGGAVLTPFGRQLVQTYRGLEEKLSALTVRQMRGIAQHVASTQRCGRGGNSVPRQSIAKSLPPPLSRQRSDPSGQ